ncbi:MAG: single-stranded DNA-binding protein [Pseudomonadota bacterium]
MASFNKAIIAGNLGGDVETRAVGDNTVAKFSVATSERWKDKRTGERKEKTTWHSVEAWGRTAENCATYLRKGSKVLVEGSYLCDEYEKDGETKRFYKIKAHTVQFLDGRQDAQQAQQAPASSNYAAGKAGESQPDFDDDIGF